jgi:hypothetical protein
MRAVEPAASRSATPSSAPISPPKIMQISNCWRHSADESCRTWSGKRIRPLKSDTNQVSSPAATPASVQSSMRA